MKQEKRGYLEEQYRIFYLKDRQEMKFKPHFHDFYKVLVHIKGQVTYMVGDNIYSMNPGDILFIPQYQVHYAEIEEKMYERYILWISAEYFTEGVKTDILLRCFDEAMKAGSFAFHPEPDIFQGYLELLGQQRAAEIEEGYAADLYAETFLQQFLIEMNRLGLKEEAAVQSLKPAVNQHIEVVLDYINAHLDEQLSVTRLAEQLYISPSYLMHRFRADMGLTLHQYVLQKRLFASVQLLGQGKNIGEAAEMCGFRDYSTFFRAFKKLFGRNPQEFIRVRRRDLSETMLRE